MEAATKGWMTHQAAPAHTPCAVMSVLYDGLELDEAVLAAVLAPDDVDDPPLEPSPVPPVAAAGATPLVSTAAPVLAALLPAAPRLALAVALAGAEDADPPLDPLSSTSTGESGGSMGAESAVKSVERST